MPHRATTKSHWRVAKGKAICCENVKVQRGIGKGQGRRESAVTTKQSHYSLDVFSVCVFFNQKPQIAATQKMTINHPDSSREKGKEREIEIKEDSRDTQRAERTRSQTQSQTEGAVLSNTFNAWIYHDDDDDDAKR